MILVKLNEAVFEYDIHSLVKAFFPSCYVSATAEEKEYGDPIELALKVCYGENFVSIEWMDREQAKAFALRGTDGDVPSDRQFTVDSSDRIGTKNKLKQNLYEMLSLYTKRTLPWGSLTGIRPTKIPMKLFSEGKSEAEITAYMKEMYFASDEKIRLSIEIAKREGELLGKRDFAKGYSLYIGIPFCPTTCLYCSFTSYPIAAWREKVGSYLDALGREMDFAAEWFKDRPLYSVYIGGGTPTTLEPEQLKWLIGRIKQSFDLSACLEFTVEAGRPDSITREKLEVLREQGISRISINPQTMKGNTLRLIGRRHTVEQVVESFHLAREIGFDNINMDLILGLPDESIEDVRGTMEQIKALRPDNLTVHSLALKRAARLSIQREDYKDFEIVNTEEHMQLVMSDAEEIGLFPYYLYRQKGMAGNLENVGYAAAGKEGVYNILMMEEVQDIVALGAGSISKRIYSDGKIERCENVKDVSQYIARIGEMIERKRVLFE